MRVEPALLGAVLAAMLAGTTALAFDPGKAQVCVASADGTHFECRDRQAGDTGRRETRPAPPAAVAEPAATQADDAADAVPARTAPVAPAPTSPGGAGTLPNYLLQDPSSAPPATEPEPEPERRPEPAPRAPTAAAEPEPVSTESDEPDAMPPATAPRDDSAAPVAPAAATPAPAAATQAPPANPVGAPAATPAAERDTTTTNTVPPAGGALEFRRLAGSRYTLELARAEHAGAFDALRAALAAVDGRFYVVALRHPGGLSYSLLWNDFASIDDARAARARLPADVAITSGWPRRIAPLKAELGP